VLEGDLTLFIVGIQSVNEKLKMFYDGRKNTHIINIEN